MEIASGGLVAALLLGFLLGLRHATDADHVVAVSTIVSEERNPLRGVWIGVSWGLGHSTTLLVAGGVILVVRAAVLRQYQAVAPVFEFAVGAMLVLLGLEVFWKLRRKGLHLHEHRDSSRAHLHVHAHTPEAETADGPRHTHQRHGLARPPLRLKSYLVGIVHGLAGSAAVMLLLVAQAPSVWLGLALILLFGLGTVLSMAGITVALGVPFAMAADMRWLSRWVVRGAGTASLLFGAALMLDIAAGTHLLRFLPE